MDIQFFTDAAGNFILGDQAGKLILASGALGTAAFGVVDAFKPLFSRRGRGWHFERASGLEWTAYRALLQPAGGATSMGIHKLVSSRLKADPEAFLEDFVQAVEDWLDFGQDLDGVTRLQVAQGLGWGSFNEDTAALTQAERAAAPETPAPAELAPAAEERLTQALAGRAAAMRNLERRTRFALAAAEQEYVRRNRSLAMLVAVAMGLIAAGMSQAVGPAEWLIYLGIGLVAVPVAPVAKELAGSLGQLGQATADLVGGWRRKGDAE